MSTPPVNVASHLARLAAADPHRPAVHVPRGRVNPAGRTDYDTLTFAQLHADSDAVAHGLAHAGVHRGTRTALMVPPSLDFFALTFALFKAGAVPVLVDPGMGLKNLRTCLNEAEPEAFVGVSKAHAARRLFAWGRKTIKSTVNVGRRRFLCHHSLTELRRIGRAKGPFKGPEVSATEPAAVLFTSGSTGVAKGAVYTHGNFAAQVEMLKAVYGIEPGEVDLCTFPLFALFGPALGMTCVVPDMDFTRPATIDPAKAAAQIVEFGVTNLFGSPAVLRRLGEWGTARVIAPSPRAGEGGESSSRVRGRTPRPGTPSPAPGSADPSPPTPLPHGERGAKALFPTVRRAISAGAPVPAAVIERFTKLLPDTTEVFTPYGATEALPVASIGSREILSETRLATDQGKGVCVGRPFPGITVYVVPITDEPLKEWDDSLNLPAGEVGEFVVRGPVVTKQYHNRPEATRLAKVRDPHTGDVLHRMGDVGYRDDRGRLWYCGRKSHRVVTPHGTLFTEQVEGWFDYTRNHTGMAGRTALVGVTRRGVTSPVLCVERISVTPGHEPLLGWKAVEERLRTRAKLFPFATPIAAFLEHPGFPVDVRHNSKIAREQLAVWADKQLGPNWTPGAKA